MQRVGNRAIELRWKRAVEHHLEIGAIRPIRLPSELCLHDLIETGFRQRIRYRYADVVGACFTNQPDGFFNVLPFLAQISELNEVARSNAVTAKVLAGGVYLLHTNSFVHCI